MLPIIRPCIQFLMPLLISDCSHWHFLVLCMCLRLDFSQDGVIAKVSAISKNEMRKSKLFSPWRKDKKQDFLLLLLLCCHFTEVLS